MNFNSRYNFYVQYQGNVALYNTLTGAFVKLVGEDGESLAISLCGRKSKFDLESFESYILGLLVKGGFLVSSPEEETETIRSRFARAREETPVVLTLTTTMDCNLGCYYCYEQRSQKKLTTNHVADIIDLAKASLERQNKRSLHVDWYGGEPMLNQTFLEDASSSLQKLCNELKVSYHASIISNGTCWPKDVERFIKQNRIRQVQISLDGLRNNHNKRRRYRKEFVDLAKQSSFDECIELIDKLLDYTRVDVRFNFDKQNSVDWSGLLEMAQKRNWFKKPYKAVIQPARISAYSEHSSFMRNAELSFEEFQFIRTAIKKHLPENVTVEESEIPDGFPYPRFSVCAALAKDSVVVGAEGALYRCGLQVGENNRIVGELGASQSFIPLPQLSQTPINNDSKWWDNFDVTELPKCSKCSYMPICWGGCPKKHLEGDTHALDEQTKYWHKNLPKQIAKRAEFSIETIKEFGEQHQFRVGWD